MLFAVRCVLIGFRLLFERESSPRARQGSNQASEAELAHKLSKSHRAASPPRSSPSFAGDEYSTDESSSGKRAPPRYFFFFAGFLTILALAFAAGLATLFTGLTALATFFAWVLGFAFAGLTFALTTFTDLAFGFAFAAGLAGFATLVFSGFGGFGGP